MLSGDAAHTVHPSIGSGTRVGMRDAAVLGEGFSEHGTDLNSVFSYYRANRQFGADLFQQAAIQSIKWYESLQDRLHFDPVTMAFSYMLRTRAVWTMRVCGKPIRSLCDAMKQRPCRSLFIR